MITSRAPVLSTQNHIINPHAPRAEIIIIFNIRTFSFISGKIWDVYIWNPNHWNIKPMKINEWIYQIKLWKLQHFYIENASFCQFLENFPLFGHIFNFCRIQSILVKNDIFAHFCKILPISDYLFDFWNSFIFGKWRSIFLGRKRTLKNLSERSIETKSIGSARRKNSNFSWNNTLFWVV